MGRRTCKIQCICWKVVFALSNDTGKHVIVWMVEKIGLYTVFVCICMSLSSLLTLNRLMTYICLRSCPLVLLICFFISHLEWLSHFEWSCMYNKTWPMSFSNIFMFQFFRSPICEEIIHCRGDHVRFGVRVRVFPYPELACATWVMFACKYKSIVWPQYCTTYTQAS